VENFFLYDLYSPDGHVDENVFAYSNVHNDERGLVLYHNRFADTRGWIKTSAAYLDKSTGDLRQKSLGEALGLPFEGYVIFKDYVTHLEYIRSCEELWSKGLYVELHAYQHHVFMDWRFVDDPRWGEVYAALNGAGVASMQGRFDEMFGVKETVVEEVKAKKPRKKKVESGKKTTAKKSAAKKPVKETKKPAKKKPAAKTKTTAKKAGTKKKSTSKGTSK
jgi:hypothetical protein